MRQMTATGVPVRRLATTDGTGRVLSDAEVEERQAGMLRCCHCGQTINRPCGEPREGEQTVEDVRRLLGPATYVLTFGGAVAVDCWLEHRRWALRYIWLERLVFPDGPSLVERAYANDPSQGGAYGIFPILAKEYAL